MDKINEIFNGIVNSSLNSIGQGNQEIEILAKNRISVCNSCREQKRNLLNVTYCNICGCNLEWKTRSKESKCPLNKWYE